RLSFAGRGSGRRRWHLTGSVPAVPAAPPRTLSTRELNRALLARQMLLERAAVPLPGVLEQMGGLQAQYAPSMYVGLWSRVAGFRRDDLTRALEKRTVVQATLLRVREQRRVWSLRAMRRTVDPAEVEAASDRFRERLRNGPIRRSELDRLVGKELSVGVGLWLDLVRAPPSGTWERRRADLFAPADDWVPAPAGLTADAAREHLVRRYLGGFGPSGPGELADWAGLRTGDVAPVLERLPLRRFVSEDGRPLYDLPDAPLPHAQTPAPVRFLPTWDAVLLAHARAKAVLAEAHRPLIFSTRNPHSSSTFLVDGTVAGTWKYEDRRVRLDSFEPLAPSVRLELEDEAERLAAFHA
ncbi:MAG: winged helix DNA-binding domain-containing protein, partial [Acidimicrobiales bacterium]